MHAFLLALRLDFVDQIVRNTLSEHNNRDQKNSRFLPPLEWAPLAMLSTLAGESSHWKSIELTLASSLLCTSENDREWLQYCIQIGPLISNQLFSVEPSFSERSKWVFSSFLHFL